MDAAQGVAHSWDGDMAVHAGMMGCGAMLSKLTGVLPGPCPKLAKVDWGGVQCVFLHPRRKSSLEGGGQTALTEWSSATSQRFHGLS